MSYMRGEYYVYSSGSHMNMIPGTMPMPIFDALVMMRYNEMSKKERNQAEKKAIEISHGNFGCDAIAKKHKLPTVVDTLKKVHNNNG